ncbi:MAG: transposase [Clostridia bacterium]|nr:transposase [Clostridia bacterium]
MSRVPRMYLNTEYFHIITQGINKNYIFNESTDIKLYIKKMYELKNKYNIKIIAYCIMNNHAHILINSKTINNLSKYMHDLNTIYACYYNKKYKRIGYVFRDRYKAEGIYSEKHLYNCINYIYNNPVKAKICCKPEDYLYSNYKKIKSVNINNEYAFMDIDEDTSDTCNSIINKYLNENNCSIEELKKNKQKLYSLIVLLKKDYKISLRNIAMTLNINRETVRKLFNQK